MNGTGLTNLEIQDLINKYKSELRKLDYQTNDIKATIAELEEILEIDLKRQDTTVTTRRKGKRKPGRPPKIKAETKGKIQKSREEGYRLSVWDKFVLDGIKDSGKVLINTELLDIVKQKAIEKKIFTNDYLIKEKLNRILQKLANRRKNIVKVKYQGRGFAYALPKWVNPNGSLDKQYEKK
jgi:hypothetical protein